MNLIYKVNEKPNSLKEWFLYTLQMLLAVFVATVLIANICGTPISSCLLGAGIATIIYELITGFKSPMFISSCGATCSAVIGALAMPGASPQNYLMVAIGGLFIAIIYCLFGAAASKFGIEKINKLFPPYIVGSITILIGLNLAMFMGTYTHNSSTWEVVIAIIVMFVTALCSHYFKGFKKTIPLLFGLIVGYILALVVTLIGWAQLINFDAFKSIQWYPDLTCFKWNVNDFSWSNLLQVIILFIPVTLCSIMEHYSDHQCLSNIIGEDLIHKPGLNKTLIGDGVASAIGTVIAGLPNTSYGESIATIGFSKVASVWVSFTTAIMLIILSFVGPLSAFIQTIPSCVFGGCALILYGYIACSSLKVLIHNKINLDNNKTLIITSVILTSGISGIFLFNEALTGVSLAMILGFGLNLILKDK